MGEPLDPVLVRECRDLGLSHDVLRGPSWSLLTRGLHRPKGWTPSGRKHWAAMSRVLPADSAAGHLTGAALRGWWLPQLLEPPPLFATTVGSTHVQRLGVYVRRSPRTRTECVNGVRLVAEVDTVHELAGDLSLLDLVPILESAWQRGGVKPAEVVAAAPPRMRGLRTLCRAAALADVRSESWWETMLRLVHELAGIRVEPQQEIRTALGFLVARVDLRVLGTNRVPEYDGEDHRRRARHRDDLRREKEMRRMGLDRWGYTSPEIEHHPGQIVRDAETALGLPHDPRRTDRWSREARVATVTASGRSRLTARLNRYRQAAHRRASAPSSGAMRA